MANKKPLQPLKKTAIHPKKTAAIKNTTTLFDALEQHLATNQKNYIIAIVGIALVLSFLCFDAKISLANDDALYIESGARYAKDFFAKESFYLANAPLYPTLLGIIIKIFGVNLIILKCFSILFFCSGIAMLYLAFRNRIPYVVLFPALLLTAINFPFLMYASLTYTECLYLLMIGICFYINFKSFDTILEEEKSRKQKIIAAILIGLSSFLLLLTRNIALVAIVPVLVFLIYKKKYMESGVVVTMFIFLYYLYRFLVKLIWHIDQSQYAGQKLIYQKDAYNPSLGMETTSGYITRLIDNAQIYIGQRLMYVLGFKEEISTKAQTIAGKASEINSDNKLIVFFFIVLVLTALYYMHKNKQYFLMYSTLFFSCLLGATFIALQTSWGQTRFIMIYLPLILMSFFYLLYHLGKTISFTQYALPFVFFILFISSLKLTITNASERFPVFKENIKGDPSYGYTPDWQNYIKMTNWCAKEFPNKTNQIAVRKAPMSFIFSGGKEFYGIYSAPTQNADSLLMPLKASNVNYLMLSELRINPSMYIENQFINTMHRYAYYIQVKYPQAFEFVHQEGDLEKAQLYRIRWNYIDSMQKMEINNTKTLQ